MLTTSCPELLPNINSCYVKVRFNPSGKVNRTYVAQIVASNLSINISAELNLPAPVASGVLQSYIGGPNHGSWCNSSNGFSFYMNTSPNNGAGIFNGNSTYQGGCNSNVNWDDNFLWQVWSK